MNFSWSSEDSKSATAYWIFFISFCIFSNFSF